MIEVQCTSCHTRYRIDERVLPEGLPTFKCSRCGHVFSFEPRKSRSNGHLDSGATRPEAEAKTADESPAGDAPMPEGEVPPDISEIAVPAEPLSASQDLPTGAAGAGVSSNAKLAGLRPESNKEAESRRRSQPDWQDPSAHQLPENADALEAANGPAPELPQQVTARHAERFYSRAAFTREEPDPVSGENLSFDFADEEPAPDQARLARRSRGSGLSKQAVRESAQWQVGDEDSTPEVDASNERRFAGEGAIGRRSRARSRTKESRFTEGGIEDEEEAPVYNRAMTHSARFFVLLVFLVGVGFGATTLLIHGAPGRASAVLSSLPLIGDRFVQPATPAKLVALRDLNAVYQQGKEGRKALLVSGSAENVSTESLRLVQLTAAIHDAQGRSLASQAVYCGNNVSAGMVGQMTPHEIEFFQKLEPAKTFALEPSASCRFVAVFMNPPSTARAYDVAVSQAIAGTAQTVEDSAP
jgi:predicted Zn finger-like uncharacterized protein